MTALSQRTYARALLEAAGDSAVTVSEQLATFAAIREDAPAEWRALNAPGVSVADAHAVIDGLLKDGHALTRNVLKLLADNGRLDEAPALAEEFTVLVREQQKQLDVHVTSAIELPSTLRDKLENQLSGNTGKQVTLHTSVDPSIIGGLVVQHGDTLIDTSLRGRLDQLRLVLSRPGGSFGGATTSSTSNDQ